MADEGVPSYTKQDDGTWVTESIHETLDGAILAALDRMEEGDTIKVHGTECSGPDACNCKPRTWLY